jgi:hypothetical protein
MSVAVYIVAALIVWTWTVHNALEFVSSKRKSRVR